MPIKNLLVIVFLLVIVSVFGSNEAKYSQKVTRIYVPLAYFSYRGFLEVTSDTCRFTVINPRNKAHNAIIPLREITKCRRGYSLGIPNRIVVVTPRQRYYFFSYRRAMIDAINAEMENQKSTNGLTSK